MKPLYIFIFILISLQSSAQVPPYTATVNSGAPGGYYFSIPLRFDKSASTQMIFDSAGNVVYYKPFLYLTHNLQLQPNGLISYFNARSAKYYLMDSTFTIIDTVGPQNGYVMDAHEFQILPNGHYLFLASEIVPMDLSAYDYFENDSTAGSANAKVTCLIIQELDQNKNVVFEWHSKNYFPFNSTDPFFLSDTVNVDWIHSNAIEVDTDGNLLLSSRHFDEITKINRQDSSIMWRFGGKYNQFTFIGDSLPFYGQHDIRRLSNGHISLYDDGNHFTPHGARACEFAIDETNKTAQLVWSYVHDSAMYSNSMGSVRRTLQGATTVDYGQIDKKDNICFDVLDSSGSELFNLTFADTLYSYRTYNYPTLPWSFNRPQITCSTSGDTLYLSAPNGQGSYQWSNGMNTQTIAVTSPGTYSVFVPYGQGGFISSLNQVVTDVQSFCATAAVAEAMQHGDIKIFPNPAHNQITISSSYSNDLVSPVIKDLSGRIVEVSPIRKDLSGNSITYDISSMASGFYFLSVEGQSYKFIKN